MDDLIIAVCAGVIGAGLSLIAACSRYNKFVIMLVLISVTQSAYSQVPGKEPGWWLDDSGNKADAGHSDKKDSAAKHPTIRPVTIIKKKTVFVRKPAARHHIRPHYHKPHHHWHRWHRCKFLFLRWWCGKR